MAQRISANALHALMEALASVFWFKNDLKKYLVSATGQPELIASLDWTYKRTAVDDLFQRLSRNPERHRELVLGLMLDVAEKTSFPQLQRADDPKKKIAEAKAAITELRKYTAPYEKELLDQERAKEKIAAARAEASEQRHMRDKLAALMQRYVELVGLDDAAARGHKLEALLRDLFALFDLDPKAAFKIYGEQIDGSFTLSGTHFLLEAKWTKSPTERRELDAFKSTIESKLENTLGLFVSINGFDKSAVELHSNKGSLMLLMTGADLYAVLDGRIDLPELIQKKHRHASQTGQILYEAHAVLGA
jgi:hypothetical protein